MENTDNEIKLFISWFGKNTSISLESRHFVVGSFIKNKGFSDQALKVINQEMSRLYNRTISSLNFLEEENKWLLIEIAQESDPATSTKEHFIKEGMEKIETISDRYVNQITSYNSRRLKSAELGEQQQDQNQVSALKASLGI